MLGVQTSTKPRSSMTRRIAEIAVWFRRRFRCSGSIRIHEAEVQQAVFRVMGMGEEEQQEKFGFLLEALQMGAPPHGGFAMGIDRFIAQLAREPDIRQVTAFPKVASGSDPLTGAPTLYPDSALKELGIRLLDPQPE